MTQSTPPPRRWLRRLLAVAATLLVLVVLTIVAAAWWLRSPRGHAFLLDQAQRRASTALGVAVTLGDFTLHWNGLAPSVDLRRVAIAGAAPYAYPPLLQAANIHIAVQITSLRQREWHLTGLELDRPRVFLVWGPEGRTNLPGGAGGGANLWDLGVRRLVVRDATVSVNGRARALSAELHQVQFETRYDPAARRYSGQLSYRDAQIEMGHWRAPPHDLDLAFAATPAGVDVPSLRLRAPGVELQASGRVRGYQHPQVEAHYQLALQLTVLRQTLPQPGLPTGSINVTGTAGYANGALAAEGSFASRRLNLVAAGLAAPVTGLRGAYRLAQGELALTGIHAAVLGGALTAALRVRDVLGAAQATLQYEIQGAALGEMARLPRGSAVLGATLAQLGVAGQIASTGHAAWQGALQGFTLAAQAQLQATLAPPGAPPLPVRGSLQARVEHGAVNVAAATLATPLSSLEVSGNWGPGVQLAVAAHSRDLRELETVAGRVLVALGQPAPPALGLAGAGGFTGTLTGTRSAPALEGQLALAPLDLRGTRWRSLAVQVAVHSGELRLTQGELQAAPQGRIQFAATLGLNQWALHATSSVEATLRAEALSLAALAPLLGRPLPVTGTVEAEAQLRGSLQAPVGRGEVQLHGGQVAVDGVSEAVPAATLRWQGNGQALTAELEATLSAGAVRAQGSYDPATRAYRLEVDAPHLQLARLAALRAHQVPVAGELALHAAGAGTLADPELHATLSAARLQVVDQTLSAITVQATLAHHQLRTQLAATALQTPVQGEVQVELRGALPATASLDAPAVPLAPLLLAFAPTLATTLRGQTAIQAKLRGPLRHPEQIQGTVTLPKLELVLPHGVRIAAAAPLQAQLAQGQLTLAPAPLQGNDTDLLVAGRLALAPPYALEATAKGSVNLDLAQVFVPDLSVAGRAQIQVRVAGTVAQPTLDGQITLAQVSVAAAGWPAGLQNGVGELHLSASRLDITRFTGQVGGGALSASGGLAFQPARHWNVVVGLHQAQVQFPVAVRSTLSADLTLSGSAAASTLAGRVRVEEVSLTPQFEFAKFVSQLTAPARILAAPGSLVETLGLNLTVTTPNQISAAAPDFSLRANANLTVRGSAADPVVLGRMDLSSGDLIFRGNRYVLQSGTLDFTDPTRTAPVVNIAADTSIQNYDLHLRFQGSAEALRTSYSSNPALPQADIINLLAFGRASEAATSTAPGNLGAESLIASAVSSQITDRVQRFVGLSQLSVDPVLGGFQQGTGARITVQQRVTSNLFVTFSTDVPSTLHNVVELQYNVTPRMSLSTVRNQNGGFSVAARFKKSW